MSLDPLLWAIKDAPVADAEERVILVVLAETADEDGCNAYPSQATISRRAMLADRTVRKRLAEMEERGVLARGDQAAARRIPADRRPVVWDLQIPYSWFPSVARINDGREQRGRPPLTPEARPDLAEAPPPRRRVDLGVPRKAISTGRARPGVDRTTSPPDKPGEPTGLQVRPDYETLTAGLQVPDGRTTSPTTLSYNSPHNPPPPPLPPAQERWGSHLPPKQGGGGGGGNRSSTSETQTSLVEVVREVRRQRQDWTPGSVEAALRGAVEDGRTPADAAKAMLELAADPATVLPRRIREESWWALRERRRARRDDDSGPPVAEEGPRHCGECPKATRMVPAETLDPWAPDPRAAVPCPNCHPSVVAEVTA